MKKIIKISVAIFVLSSFILALNTHGAFEVAINDQVKYKMLESQIHVELGSSHETFSGFKVDSTVIEEDTSFKLNIEDITASQLDWNSTIDTTTFQGTCPLAPDTSGILMLLLGYDLAMFYDFSTMISGGEIEEKYLAPFYFDPFVDVIPATWIMFEQYVADQTTIVDMLYSSIPYTCDSSYSDANDTMTIWWYLDVFNHISPDPLTEISLINNVTFSYDILTGVMLETDLDFQYNGSYGGTEFKVEMDHHIIQSDKSDFIEFLDEYKWYFVGGGGGLIALILAFAIIIRVVKRR